MKPQEIRKATKASVDRLLKTSTKMSEMEGVTPEQASSGVMAIAMIAIVSALGELAAQVADLNERLDTYAKMFGDADGSQALAVNMVSSNK